MDANNYYRNLLNMPTVPVGMYKAQVTHYENLLKKNAALQAAGDALAEAVESFRGYTTYEPIREALQTLLTAWTQAKEMT